MLSLQSDYRQVLKDLIFNPSYTEVLLKIKREDPVSLDDLREGVSDEENLRETLSFLLSRHLVVRDGNTFYFKPSADYQGIDTFLQNFERAKNIFYDQVRSGFEQKAFNIIILQDKLNETFDNLNRYSLISSRFRTFYKKKDLYEGSGDLAFKEIGVDAFEVYEVTGKSFKNVYARYQNTKEYQTTAEENQAIQNSFNLKEPIILNTPQTESIREKKIFAVFPIIEEEKVVNLLLFGFDSRKISMIKDYIVELIDGFSLNFRLTLKTVEMIKVLEDRVAQRTKELKAANSQLKKINAEIEDKNRAKIKEIEIAANIQRTVIPDPKQIPRIGCLSVGAVWIPMPMKKTGQEKVNVKEVSGDFFNYYQVSEDEVGFVIADASGHGIPAALLTMMASAAFSFNSRKGGTTADICSRSNKEVYNAIGDIGYYLTAFYLKINLKTLEVEFTNAGHHKAIIYRRKTGQLEEWDSEGFFIGSFEEAVYGYGRNRLYPGDKVIMTTDGIEEARRIIVDEATGEEKLDFYEEERLKNFILTNKDLHAKDFCEKLLESVEEFCAGYPADDDRTVLVIDVGTIEEDSANVIMEKVITYMNEKEFKLAEKEVLHYIEKFGENPDVLLQLAEVYYLSNQMDKAQMMFQKVQKLSPKDHRPLQGLTKVANAQQDFEKAAEYSREATRLMILSKKKK